MSANLYNASSGRLVRGTSGPRTQDHDKRKGTQPLAKYWPRGSCRRLQGPWLQNGGSTTRRNFHVKWNDQVTLYCRARRDIMDDTETQTSLKQRKKYKRNDSPRQSRMLLANLNPSLHVHTYDPGVFVHRWTHPWMFSAHSSISTRHKTNNREVLHSIMTTWTIGTPSYCCYTHCQCFSYRGCSYPNIGLLRWLFFYNPLS